MIDAYPLNWPEGFPRTKYSKKSRFQTRFKDARDGLMESLRKMEANNIVVSTNIPIKSNNLPYANQKEPLDRGVAVYFEWKKQSYSLACDKWDKVGDNIQAIRRTIEAMRDLERWGVSDMLKRTFSGFKALPDQTGAGKDAWWIILGVDPNANEDSIKKAYYNRIKDINEFYPNKYNFNIILVKNEIEKRSEIEKFKTELSSTDKTNRVLILNFMNRWIIYGFNDKKEFQELHLESNDDLAKELDKPEPRDRNIIIKKLISKLNYELEIKIIEAYKIAENFKKIKN